ncbi:MAG: diaminopimelate epimerase [Limisphaerales bacterium]
MRIAFTKMSGAGNDFILVDNRDGRVALTPVQVARLCRRQFGVGADGVLLLRPAADGAAEWAWDFYNSDGSTADMCGNGARCFARFVRRAVGGEGPLTFATGAGVITGTFDGERVTVNLTAPHGVRLDETVATAAGPVAVHSINTGVPHAVVFVADADAAMVQERGRELRFHPHFGPRGTNVNFVQVLGHGAIRVRTYERGVEGETLACGTGVTAAALVSARRHRWPAPVDVQVQGGDRLQVEFGEDGGAFTDVRLTGPATFVFEGMVEV